MAKTDALSDGIQLNPQHRPKKGICLAQPKQGGGGEEYKHAMPNSEYLLYNDKNKKK